jgi:hypothetical protein
MEQKASAMQYLKEKGLVSTIETMVNDVCRAHPEDPATFMVRFCVFCLCAVWLVGWLVGWLLLFLAFDWLVVL